MMKAVTTVVLFLFLVHGARAQGGLSLEDYFDTPNDPTKAPEKPKNEEPKKPAGGGELSLDDFFDKEPKKPAGGGEPNVPAKAPEKPKNDQPKKPANDEGISDSDLLDVLDGYKPDGGRSGGRSGGGPVQDPNRGGTDEKPQEAGSGQIAGIVSAVAMALVGAASSYIAYQKKKLCFKGQGGSDLERGKGQHGVHSEPQVLSNLLKTS